MICTGNGNDTVEALTPDGLIGSFTGGGTIDLGKGDDLIRGFGNQTVDGGKGFDTAELGINATFGTGAITLGMASGDIQIMFGGQTMTFANVERFNFNGTMFDLKTLQHLVA